MAGQQLSQIRHRQHAVGKNIVHPRGFGEIAVDVQQDMVVGGSGKKRQGAARDRPAHQFRQGVADVQIGRGGAHARASFVLRTTVRTSISVQSCPS